MAWKEILALLYKELLVEWKLRYAFNSLLLYVCSMIVVVSFAYLGVGEISSFTWVILFWLLVLFASVNAVAKSFMSESQGQSMYLYSMVNPSSIIIAKIIYNFLLLLLLSFVTFFLFATLNSIEVIEEGMLIGFICLGSIAIASNLTLVSAIAAKAENSVTLFAVLGFPVIIPVLLSLIKGTQLALDKEIDLSDGIWNNEVFIENVVWLVGISFVLWVSSVILFPFVWRN